MSLIIRIQLSAQLYCVLHSGNHSISVSGMCLFFLPTDLWIIISIIRQILKFNEHSGKKMSTENGNYLALAIQLFFDFLKI